MVTKQKKKPADPAPETRRPYTMTRSEFARMVGVSPTTIGNHLNNENGSLVAAGVGSRVDANHPDAIAFVRKRRTRSPDGGLVGRARTGAKRQDPDTLPADVIGPRGDKAGFIPRDLAEYSHMTLAELGERFATVRQFRDFLDALKRLEDIREKRLANEESTKQVINRDMVRTHIFGAIEAGNRRLLGDVPKTIVRRVYALAKSGAPIEEAEGIAREIISSQLAPVKTTAARVLRKL